MRGSQPVSDQTAMNNKHIKRFHFSINRPPTSIRCGSRASQGADSFSSDDEDQIVSFFLKELKLLLCPHLNSCYLLSYVQYAGMYVNMPRS